MADRPSTDKQEVRAYYETFGWSKPDEETFADAARFEDLRPVSWDYRHQCHLRVNRYLTKGGCYLLDVASGPVQYSEFLTYSEGYETRICADLSLTALREASKTLDGKGFFVQCDIVHLPFAADSLDGIVSLHTVYHVPADEQLSAFTELQRVLKPNSTAVVVYSWSRYSLFMLVTMPYKAWILLVRALRRLTRRVAPGIRPEPPRLYFHVNPYGWFQRHVKPRLDFDVVVWRSVNVQFLRAFVHDWLWGRGLLSAVYRLEERFPHLAGRFGAYPMFILRKAAAFEPSPAAASQPSV